MIRPRKYFYPRSPCGERPYLLGKFWDLVGISIHALLAESDCQQRAPRGAHHYFYPRSPCGERLQRRSQGWLRPEFLSTLSLRRATEICNGGNRNITISIHALLAESDSNTVLFESPICISIHALLAESDQVRSYPAAVRAYFYPRSPCGERPEFVLLRCRLRSISIHALLAESDPREGHCHGCGGISIHALLAESDKMFGIKLGVEWRFLSTLSLRRATPCRIGRGCCC